MILWSEVRLDQLTGNELTSNKLLARGRLQQCGPVDTISELNVELLNIYLYFKLFTSCIIRYVPPIHDTVLTSANGSTLVQSTSFNKRWFHVKGIVLEHWYHLWMVPLPDALHRYLNIIQYNILSLVSLIIILKAWIHEMHIDNSRISSIKTTKQKWLQRLQ